MGRIIGYISNELESRLVRLIEISKLEQLKPDSLSYKDSLKYTLLNDPFVEVKFEGKAGFDVKLNHGEVIAEAIIKDFIIGHERRTEQYNNLIKLISIGKGYNPAWPLITAYYCAFFCAIDISKTLSRVNINFTKDEMDIIKSKANGDLSELGEANNFTGIVTPECTKIKFMSTGSKPHHYAWDNLYQTLIKGAIKKHEDWTEFSTLKHILLGDKNWELPSAVRNTWNYANPFMFKKKGIETGVEFVRIAGKADSAEYWLSSNYTSHGVVHQAGSIALLCEMLYQATNTAYVNMFEPN